jgi:SSS family solute:Na+ symporter
MFCDPYCQPEAILSETFSSLDWIVLAAYFLMTMSVGFFFHRKSSSIEGFTAGGRSLPGWVCGLSIFATYLSSISFLALPGKSYSSDFNAFVFSLSLPVAAYVAVRFFLPYYRSTTDVSAYAHLERRFGIWARIYASITYLLTQMMRMGMVMYLMALPLSILLDIDIRLVILATGISVTVYSFLGGVIAVIWADAIQAIILIAGALTCLMVILFGLPHGPAQLFDIASQHDKFSLGDFAFTPAASTFWVVLVYGIVMNLQNFGIDQSYIQRYIASKSARQAAKSVWLGALLYIPVSALFLFIGTGLFAYYRTHPADLQPVKNIVAAQQLASDDITPDSQGYDSLLADKLANLSDADIADKVFPHFIGTALPAGVTGLLIAAIFSAAMSTVSTSLNSSATLIMTDWHKRFIRPNASERQSMIVLYAATVACGIIGTSVAFMCISVKSALDTWWKMSGIFGGGMLGLFLLGMISRRAKNAPAATAVSLGLVVICWMTLSLAPSKLPLSLRCPFHAFMIPVAGTLTILLTGLLITRILASRRNASD